MTTYILLFRGINVGGHHLLPMKDLKSLLEEEGYEDVKTYIQSGNVVLKSKSTPKSTIAAKINTVYGFSPEILILSKTEFERVVSANPFPLYAGNTVHFYFCAKKPALDKLKLESLASDSEKYQLQNKVFYLHAPDGIGRSKLVSRIEACLGVSATGRNLHTVLKLSAMLKNI